MRYSTNLMDARENPAEWARRREDQGWDILSVSDHLFLDSGATPHAWVSAAAIAQATSRVSISTAFVNNLLRSPVEVAQAALQMQNVAQGRFELGLGAGWARTEVEGAGMRYPGPGDRAGAFIEAVQIIRSLVHTGACSMTGDYYQIEVPHIGPLSDSPPPLAGSVGGPRTATHVTPHLDRVELKLSSITTRGGTLDLDSLAAIPDQHLTDMVALVRDVRPEIEISMLVVCNAVEDDATRQFREKLGSSLFRRFFGAPEEVVEGFAWLEEAGISRVQVSALHEPCLDRLAPLLFGDTR